MFPGAVASPPVLLAHTGGAAALDLPPWLLGYGAAAIVLVVTAGLRGRLVVAAARDDDPGAATPPGDDDRAPVERPPRAAPLAIVGRVAGLGGLGLVLTAALAGPAASAANLAPSAVLVVWWVGLPTACAVAGDVMAWLDPFGTLAAAVRRALGRGTPTRRSPVGLLAATAAGSLAAFTWWALAYHGAREPAALGWFLAGYTALAVAAGTVWGPTWPRAGEGFGALSSGLAAARRTTPEASAGPARPPTAVLLAVVAVWAGGLAFDLFSGTRAWVELAGSASGWARTGRATACLAVAVAVAALAVLATVRAAGPPDREADDGGEGDSDGAARRDRRPAPVARALALAWLAAVAGAVVAHGITLLLVDGQVTLALVSDPLGRGWDLFGTADRAVDYSPLSPGVVGTAQVVVATAGGVWGAVAASRTLRLARRHGLPARRAVRALWVAGLAAAVVAGTVVVALASDLE